MFLRENPYIAILCLTAIISGCVALTAWTRRDVAPATKPFTGLMVAIAVYAVTAAFSASTFNLRPSIFWATCEYFASNSVIACYLTFTLNFTGRINWLRHHRRALVWAIPIFNILLVLTNHWHNLVWQSFTSHPDKNRLIFQHGIGFYWIAICFYIYVITGSLLVARGALRSSNLYRKQALVVIASSIPPLTAGSIYIFGLLPSGINLLPMSFLFTGVIYFTSLFRDRLFDLVPIARDTIIEEMSEGVMVIDNAGRIIDMNRAAKQCVVEAKHLIKTKHPVDTKHPVEAKHLIEATARTAIEHSASILGESVIGQSIETALSHWPELANHCRSLADGTTAIVEKAHIPYYLEVRITQLHNRQQYATGKVIILRDITQQQQDQIQIKQANAELTRQLTENQILRDQLEEQAIRDGLTQLFNRRYFEETIPAEFAKAKRSGQPLSIILLDIDHFKRINDTYGHLAGDHALRVFAQTVQQQIRESDIACRYGGEEFVVAMPDMPLEEACNRADRIRRAFKNTTLEFEGRHFSATVSIGVGTIPDTSNLYTLEHPDHLLQKVDQALYRAKDEGRDRIETIRPSNPQTYRQMQLEEAIRKYQQLIN